ncbi:hypothetical protein SAMN05421837_114183 [Amycolatopsis pretoriensis]|uniref:Outer membrane channel protein CpnT-like N-terminal domain-containing protein n=1 Tax=Amycolatopsis pretoriensis TaxID=218821 RepID=A0A1H5RGZ0_9PSEU|nr:hypothetical protein [Amycolatopsis pretoriensis]SEF37622.1 hypothetical protein SAMN05421837_114183 [Amycolatopsis pretoriensis]
MAVAEPANELWTAVKAIANPWPPDDEDQVADLADDWRKAGETANLAGTELSDQRQAAQQAWSDQAGQAMGQNIGKGAVTLESQRQGAEQQAAMADRYAQALTSVKNAIVQAVNANLPAYLQLGNPMYGAAGQAKQQEFARQVAAQLQALVAAQTQGMHAPPAAPDTDTTLGQVGDIAGAVSAVAGGLALIPVLAPFAAPVALLAGATALAAHGVDMIATESYDDPNAWIGLGGDAVGLIPAGRAVWELAELAPAATGVERAVEVAGGVVDVGLQVPGMVDLAVDDEGLDTVKDIAGGAGLNKTLLLEALRRLR